MFTGNPLPGGRIVGIGLDILRRNSLYEPYLQIGDPFLHATYSVREQEDAEKRRDPYTFYETRFCCKEAVFKSLSISGERVRFCDIEILSDENSHPVVSLQGEIGRMAAAKGITEVLLSLSYDNELAEAVAVACQGESGSIE